MVQVLAELAEVLRSSSGWRAKADIAVVARRVRRERLAAWPR